MLIEPGSPLPGSHDSLALGVPASKPGTIHVLATTGGIQMNPGEGREILFGRNRPEVHVCIGEYDQRVSRRHGRLTCRGGQWWVGNTGRLPVRLPGPRMLFPDDDPIPLATGYTPLFVGGSRGREHLLELHVSSGEPDEPLSRPGDLTRPPNVWRLDATERLVMVVLAQRYLLHEAYPQPLAWRQAAEHLADLQPDEKWGPKRVEHLVAKVRNRLSRHGVFGLTREEVGEPVGNTLNHNLIRELLEGTTLVPTDLRLLDPPD